MKYLNITEKGGKYRTVTYRNEKKVEKYFVGMFASFCTYTISYISR